MKKFIALLLALILAFSLVGCGGSKGKNENGPTLEEKIEDAIRAEASVEIIFKYEGSLSQCVCTTIDDNGNGTYDVYGYVIVKDYYGVNYRGNFDAVVRVTESDGVIIDTDVEAFDLDTPRKQ